MLKRRKRNFLIFLASGAAIYLGATWFLADRYLHPARRIPTLPTTLQAVNMAKTLTWVSPGWERAKVVVIFAHGYGGTGGTWKTIGPALASKGYGVVVPAMPGQDASPISSVGFGRPEADLITDLSAEVRQRNPKAKVVLMGLSLGGAACWMASEPVQPAAIITDGAFADLDSGIRGYLSALVPGASSALVPVIKLAEWRSGLQPATVRPIDSAAKWKGPALILAGGKDRIATTSVVEEYRKAVPQVQTVDFPGALHSRTFGSNPEKYVQSVLDFLADSKLNP